MHISVCRVTLMALLSVLLPYFTFLLVAYHYPRFAAEPDLHRGLLTLGHGTSSTQRLWLHCNYACRHHACATYTEHAESHERCMQTIQAHVQLLSADSHQPMLSEHHVSKLTLTHVQPLVNASVWELYDLQPCTSYIYLAQMREPMEGGAAMTIASETFRTASADTEVGYISPSTHANAVANIALSPAGHESITRVVWGSCLGISPFSSIRVFSWLASHSEVRPDAVLLLGDSVYVDLPAMEDSAAYAHVWSDDGFRQLFTRVPFVGMYDDHELANDWTIADSHERFDQSMLFFDEFVSSKNPEPPLWNEGRMGHVPIRAPLPAGQKDFNLAANRTSVRPRYFNFTRGAHASFFVLDMRQYASAPVAKGGPADPALRTKLGPIQLAHVKHWLLHSPQTFKFLCSSVPWSQTAFKIVDDSWVDALPERDALFDFIVAHGITGVVLLSADLHYAAVFHFRRWNIHEFTVSPLQSFGLPAWITHSDDEVTEYRSSMRNHAGMIEITEDEDEHQAGHSAAIDTPPRGPLLNVSIFRYQYGTPQRHRSILLRAADMQHRAVDRSFAVHEDPQ